MVADENLPQPLLTKPNSLAFADVARILGIGLVVVNHLMMLGNNDRRVGFQLDRFADYFGVLGVAMLFVLSGYLLTRPFLAALVSNSPIPSASRFYFKRFLRIYPLYIFAVLCVSLLDYFSRKSQGLNALSLITHIFLIHNLVGATAETIEPPLWTMAVDAQFYLMLPIVAFVFGRLVRSASVQTRTRALWSTIAAAAILSVIIRFCVMLWRPSSAASFEQQIVFLKQLPEMGFSFAVGAALGLWEQSGYEIRNRSRFIVFGVLVALLHAASRVLMHKSSGVQYALGFAVYDAIAAVAAGLIFMGLPRFANNRSIVLAAGTSYAVYLIHYPLLAYVADLLRRPGATQIIALLATLAVVVIPCAWLLHTFIEEPFLKIKSKIGNEAVAVKSFAPLGRSDARY